MDDVSVADADHRFISKCVAGYYKDSCNTQLELLSLRPRQIHLAFSPKNIAVEVGDPLPAAGGHIEIADRKLDLRRDVSPIKLREFINDIGGRLVAQLLVSPISSNS